MPDSKIQDQKIYKKGQTLTQAETVMILTHGRGGNAPDILELANLFFHPDIAYLAPQATNSTWYPYSFLAPLDKNEPDLSSALQVIKELVEQARIAHIPEERIIIGGFSQGACLACEYVARNPRRYGGLFIFSGGVIGPLGKTHDYQGSLDGTPVFIGCSDNDAHIPLVRVHETAEIFHQLGGNVTKKIYAKMGHKIVPDEIDQVKEIIQKVLTIHNSDIF